MLGEELSRALSDISDDKIEAAMENRPVHRKWWPGVVAAAAVLALILTAALWPRGEEPGQQLGSQPTQPTQTPTAPTETKGKELVQLAGALKMYTYHQENLTEEELKQYEVTDAIKEYDNPWLEFRPHTPIRFTFGLQDHIYEGADIRLKLYTPYGAFAVADVETGERGVAGKNAETRMYDLVCWHPYEDLEALKESKNPGPLYLRILIYADGQLAGFGLVELGCNYILDGWYYAVNFIRFVTVCYPKVDGQFQDVTEEDIMDLIAEYEQSMTVEYMESHEDLRVDFGEE